MCGPVGPSASFLRIGSLIATRRRENGAQRSLVPDVARPRRRVARKRPGFPHSLMRVNERFPAGRSAAPARSGEYGVCRACSGGRLPRAAEIARIPSGDSHLVEVVV